MVMLEDLRPLRESIVDLVGVCMNILEVTRLLDPQQEP
jgi:hypothetical protein